MWPCIWWTRYLLEIGDLMVPKCRNITHPGRRFPPYAVNAVRKHSLGGLYRPTWLVNPNLMFTLSRSDYPVCLAMVSRRFHWIPIHLGRIFGDPTRCDHQLPRRTERLLTPIGQIALHQAWSIFGQRNFEPSLDVRTKNGILPDTKIDDLWPCPLFIDQYSIQFASMNQYHPFLMFEFQFLG